MHTLPEFRCPAIAIGLIAILLCLIPVWIALGRGPWYIRVLVGISAIGLLIPMQAFHPLVFFSITGVATVLTLAAVRFLLQQYELVDKSRLSHRESSVSRDYTGPKGDLQKPPNSNGKTKRSLRRRPDFWLGVFLGLFTAGIVFSLNITVYFPDRGWLESLLVFHLIVATTIVVAMMFGDAFRRGRRSIVKVESSLPTFQMRDVLLVLVLLAVLFSLNAFALRRSPISNWYSVLVACTVFSISVSSLAVMISAIRTRWRIISFLVFVVAIGIAYPLRANAGEWLMQATAYSLIPGVPWEKLFWIFVAALVASMICLFPTGLIGDRNRRSGYSAATKRVAIVMSIGFALLFTSCLIPIGVAMSRPLESPNPVAESPRSFYRLYDEMSRLKQANPSERTLGQLRKAKKATLATDLSGRYQRIRSMARQDIRAPDPLIDSSDQQELVQRLEAFRAWARCMDNEGKFSVKQKRWTEASQFWMDDLIVGSGLGRGGDMVYSLTGIAIESIAHEGLARVRDHLPAEQLENQLGVLLDTDANREPVDSIGKRTDLMLEREFYWQYRLSLCAPRILSSQENARMATYASASLEATEGAARGRDAALRMLIAEYAIRLFRNRYGRFPSDLESLVPEFIPSVPVDPYANQPLIYRNIDGNYVVYSVGLNGKDDGGVFTDFASMYSSESDFDIDTLIRPASPPAGFGGIGGQGGM